MLTKSTQNIKGYTVEKYEDNVNGFYFFKVNGESSSIMNKSVVDYSHKQAFDMYKRGGHIYQMNYEGSL